MLLDRGTRARRFIFAPRNRGSAQSPRIGDRGRSAHRVGYGGAPWGDDRHGVENHVDEPGFVPRYRYAMCQTLLSRAAGAGVILALLGAAGSAAAATITLAKGLPTWRLGQTYVRRPGLVHSEGAFRRYSPGCVANASFATRTDYYRGVRVGWFPDFRGKLRLVDVATERAGDRSGDGFVVGASTRGAVRRRHPGAAAAISAGGPLALGASSLTVFHTTGKESFATMIYWFDARGVLTALEAFAGGC